MKIIITLYLLIFAGFVSADCECACVNGRVQALCASTLDIQPICPPRVCQITPPSVAPIQQPRVPPVGTRYCQQEQVYNQYSGQYEWREVCH